LSNLFLSIFLYFVRLSTGFIHIKPVGHGGDTFQPMIELHGAISEKAEYTFFNQIYGNSTAIALSSVLKTTGYYIQVILTTLDQNLKKKNKGK
jgi:hypothetical protein